MRSAAILRGWASTARHTASVRRICSAALLLAIVGLAASVAGQSLDDDLRKIPAAELAAIAKKDGDPQRGAVVFFQPQMACSKCHSVGKAEPDFLGPDLTKLGQEAS